MSGSQRTVQVLHYFIVQQDGMHKIVIKMTVLHYQLTGSFLLWGLVSIHDLVLV